MENHLKEHHVIPLDNVPWQSNEWHESVADLPDSANAKPRTIAVIASKLPLLLLSITFDYRLTL